MADATATRSRQTPASGGAQRRRLGRYANSSSPGQRNRGQRRQPLDLDEREQRRKARRRQRHRLRYRLRQLTGLGRVRKCGHVSVNGDGSGPALRLTTSDGGDVAGLSGLATCGSVWACPVCAAKIATRRAEELADVERFALEQGCVADMVTLTMRHHRGQSLADCWSALSAAWAAVTSGKQWTEDAEGAGLVGWVRVVEVTQGKSGWHVHVHALLVWDGATTEEQADILGQRMWQRWTMALRRKGFDSLLEDQHGDRVGVDVRRATLKPGVGGAGLHEYFVKLAHEMTGGQAKLARGGGRTPFQLLSDAVEGLADEVDLWHEWERASQGRRQMTWSTGRRDLRKWAGLGAEQTDEEIAEEEPGGDELVLLMPESWRELRVTPERVCQLLEAAEAGGFTAATALLDLWSLSWLAGKGAPPYPPPPAGAGRLDAERMRQLRGLALRAYNAHQGWHTL